MINETIIINLSNHIERKNDMIKKIEKTNITNYKFFNAIDGDKDLQKYNFNVIPNRVDYFKNREITVGEIGCALSHYTVWKYIYDNKINRTLILEDDVIFYDDFNIMYNRIQNIDFYYEFLYLGRNPLNKYLPDIGNEDEINDFIIKPKSSFNSHSYIITYECAKKLLNCNFLQNVLPVDDFISIMYDDNYPFKQYSKLFKNYQKIVAYSLKNDITNQNTSYYGSSIDNSKLYNKNIKDNYVDFVKMTTWTINMSNNYTKSEMDNFTELIDLFIHYTLIMDMNFFLNIKNDRFCFIEKFIYDNIAFHSKRLNIDLSNKYISFWARETEYDFNDIHTHIDHCDYELRKYNTQTRVPLFTSIIYFNDNNCPTLVTDITRDMYNKKNFMNIYNNKLLLSFPKILKNIVFDSGNKYHGESYLSDYEISERKAIIIAVWDKENKPLHIPYFDKANFFYYMFTTLNRDINDNELDEFDKTNELINITNRDNNIITIPINDHKIINYDFFYKLIVTKEKTIMYRFFDLIKNINNPDTIVFDFSDILKNPYENMKCYIEPFQIIFKHDAIKQIDLIEECLLLQKESLLNIEKDEFSILEKYIYDISVFHMNKLNIQLNDIYISFTFDNNINLVNKTKPFMSCVFFLEDSEHPFYITDIDNESYKYKNFQDSKVFFTIPKKMTHIVFSGGFCYKKNNNMMLTINFWKKKDCLYNTKNINDIFNKPSYNVLLHNKNMNMIESVYSIYSVEKQYNDLITNKESILSFKILDKFSKQLFIDNEDFFEEILYRNNDILLEKLLQENDDSYSFIVNIIKTNEKISKPSNQIEKMKFCFT